MRELLFGIPVWQLMLSTFPLILFAIVYWSALDLPTFKTKRKRRRVLNMDKFVTYFYLVNTAAFILAVFLYYDITPVGHDEPIIVNNGDELSVKIEAISDDLAKSAKELDAIQEKLESRIATVEELKKEAEIAENMISLSEEQVDAIQAKLNQELEASSGKSLWISILINAVFFMLGLAVQPVKDFFKGRLWKETTQTPGVDKDAFTEEDVEKFHRMLDRLAYNESTKTPK